MRISQVTLWCMPTTAQHAVAGNTACSQKLGGLLSHETEGVPPRQKTPHAEPGPPLRRHSSHVPGDAAVAGSPLQQHLQPLAQHGGHISVDARVASAPALLRLELQHHGGDQHAAGRAQQLVNWEAETCLGDTCGWVSR